MPTATWVFGGSVAAQALVAGCADAPGRVPRSISTRFIKQGTPGDVLRYHVTNLGDSGTFADRHVVTRGSDGVPIAATSVLAHTPDEEAVSYQWPMPDAPAPNEDAALRRLAIESIDVNDPPLFTRKVASTATRCWMRVPGTPRGDSIINAAVLAFASDLYTVASAWRPIEGLAMIDQQRVMSFGLTYSLWFHGPFDFADWHLLVCDTPSAAAGRSLTQGNWYTTDGRLVASVTLDSVMRIRKPRSTEASH